MISVENWQISWVRFAIDSPVESSLDNWQLAVGPTVDMILKLQFPRHYIYLSYNIIAITISDESWGYKTVEQWLFTIHLTVDLTIEYLIEN